MDNEEGTKIRVKRGPATPGPETPGSDAPPKNVIRLKLSGNVLPDINKRPAPGSDSQAKRQKSVLDEALTPEVGKLPLKKALNFVVRALYKIDPQGIFHVMLDPDLIPDYYQVIKHPMAFSELQLRILNGVYHSMEDFETDFKLIVENAKTYNEPSTIYYKEAERLEKEGQEVIEKYRAKLEPDQQHRKPGDPPVPKTEPPVPKSAKKAPAALGRGLRTPQPPPKAAAPAPAAPRAPETPAQPPKQVPQRTIGPFVPATATPSQPPSTPLAALPAQHQSAVRFPLYTPQSGAIPQPTTTPNYVSASAPPEPKQVYAPILQEPVLPLRDLDDYANSLWRWIGDYPAAEFKKKIEDTLHSIATDKNLSNQSLQLNQLSIDQDIFNEMLNVWCEQSTSVGLGQQDVHNIQHGIGRMADISFMNSVTQLSETTRKYREAQRIAINCGASNMEPFEGMLPDPPDPTVQALLNKNFECLDLLQRLTDSRPPGVAPTQHEKKLAQTVNQNLTSLLSTIGPLDLPHGLTVTKPASIKS